MPKPCVHRWRIDSTNFGRCLRCGAERQFPLRPAVDYRRLKMTASVRRAEERELMARMRDAEELC